MQEINEKNPACGDPILRMQYIGKISETIRILEGKWKLAILCHLFTCEGTMRFSELQKQIEGINQKMLIQQLKDLEKDGIVHRELFPQVPPRVEYSLTELGKQLKPALAALIEWAELKRKMEEI